MKPKKELIRVLKTGEDEVVLDLTGRKNGRGAYLCNSVSCFQKAKKKGGGVILGGANYGQGSSREHAALVPLYLGIKAVVAKSFARIHVANLINFGIVPMTLENADDYDKFAEGDQIEIKDFAAAVAAKDEAILINKTNGKMAKLKLALSARQREMLMAGGCLNYTKNGR